MLSTGRINLMTSPVVNIHSSNLEAAIEVLARAAESFRLNRFESIAYRALTISVDLVIVSFIVISILLLLGFSDEQKPMWGIFAAFSLIFVVCSGLATILVVVNIPIFLKTFNETRQIKKLGLTSLSRSLWKESRRANWIMRARGIVLFMTGLVLLGAGIIFGLTVIDFFSIGFCLVVGVVLIVVRYLRLQLEKIELSSSASQLKEALESLQKRSGSSDVVSVPSSLLEKAARIESAQIAKDRGDAVLQSDASRTYGFTIRFSRDAAAQRMALDTARRVELEDLMALLSTRGRIGEAPDKTGHPQERATLKSVGLNYEVDENLRQILITEVLPIEASSGASDA